MEGNLNVIKKSIFVSRCMNKEKETLSSAVLLSAVIWDQKKQQK